MNSENAIISAEIVGYLELLLRSVGHDQSSAQSGWRSQDPFVNACSLAALGYQVFPCDINKFPLVNRGVNNATSNIRTLLLWARDKPISGWCIKTGRYGTMHSTGLWGFDIDGPDGYASLRALEDEIGRLPKTWTTLSGRIGGGEHRLYRPSQTGHDMKSVGSAVIRGKKRLKLDQRGRGGYLVIAGSLHKSGNRYQWAPGCAPDETPLAELPPAWVEAMDKAGEAPAPKTTVTRSQPSPSSPPPHGGRARSGRGGLLVGDGPTEAYGGFNDPLYRLAITYFFKAGPEAPEEPVIATLREIIAEAPKGPGRDVSRYMSGPDLPRIVERARVFVKSVKEDRSVGYGRS